MDKTSQCQQVLKHMETFGGITAAEAIEQYKIYRLASRISDLKKRGYPIDSIREQKLDANGKEVEHWSRYFLAVNV